MGGFGYHENKYEYLNDFYFISKIKGKENKNEITKKTIEKKKKYN